jgi:DNA-binding NarL/FixJ family response regulator
MVTANGRLEPETHNGNGVNEAAPHKLRLMVVDDHPAVRLGLVQLLETQPDFEIVAVCIDAESAVARASSQDIDVAVLDYQLPTRNGLWACRRLKAAAHAPAVVVFSGFADHYLAACCAVAEADAVLNKGVLGSDLCDAVRAVARGRRLLPRVPQPLADALRRRLTEPEQLLFGMLLAGIPREHICRALGVGERELQARVSAMLRTLEGSPRETRACARVHSPFDLDRTITAARRAARGQG